MVDDRVQRDRCLAGLPVADDQFALPASDRNHGVDRLDPGLHRFFDRLPFHHAGRDALDRIEAFCRDRSFAVDRISERVHDPPDQRLAHRNRHDAARALDLVAFFDVGVVAQHHRAHLIFFQVQRDARNAAGELDQLARHHVFETVNARDSVTHRNHRSRL